MLERGYPILMRYVVVPVICILASLNARHFVPCNSEVLCCCGRFYSC